MAVEARILVVDDEPQIVRALRVGLSAHGYRVETAVDGQSALEAASVRPPEVVILDLMLPDRDGVEVCQQLRAFTKAPVIVLSAKGDEREKVRALDGGADDYLTKPFGMQELLARIRVALRRTAAGAEGPVVRSGDLVVDLERRQVTRGGEEIHLTPTEYDLLRLLALNAGRVVTHRTLIQSVLGPDYENASQNLRVFIAQLRRKIEVDRARPRYLLTEAGIGYRFATEKWEMGDEQ